MVADKLTYYDILGVSSDASREEILAAARRKSRLASPNSITSGLTREFYDIQKAVTVLKEPESREAYDQELARSPQALKPRVARGNVQVDTGGLSWYGEQAAGTELPLRLRMSTDVSLLGKLGKSEAGTLNLGVTDKDDLWVGNQVALLMRKFLCINGVRVFWSARPGGEEAVPAIAVAGNHAAVVWGVMMPSGSYELGRDGVVRDTVTKKELVRVGKYEELLEQVASVVSVEEVVGWVVVLPEDGVSSVEAGGNSPVLRLANAQGFVEEAGAFLANQAGAILPRKFAKLYSKV